MHRLYTIILQDLLFVILTKLMGWFSFRKVYGGDKTVVQLR